MKGKRVCVSRVQSEFGFRDVLYPPQELVESGELENTFPKTVSLENR